MAEAHSDVRHLLGDRLQQWLESVLRDDLIGFERQGAVVAGLRLGLAGRDRRIEQMQDRRIELVTMKTSIGASRKRLAARTFSASPMRRNSSDGRALQRSILGHCRQVLRCARRVVPFTPRCARSIARVKPTGPGPDDQHIGIVRAVHRFVSLPGGKMLSQFENHPKDTGLTTSSDGDQILALQVQPGLGGVVYVVSIDVTSEGLQPRRIEGFRKTAERAEAGHVSVPHRLVCRGSTHC